MENLNSPMLVVNGLPILKLGPPRRNLGSNVCRSRFHQHINKRSNSKFAADFALPWPKYQTICEACRERWQSNTTSSNLSRVRKPLPTTAGRAARNKASLSYTAEAAQGLLELSKVVRTLSPSKKSALQAAAKTTSKVSNTSTQPKAKQPGERHHSGFTPINKPRRGADKTIPRSSNKPIPSGLQRKKRGRPDTKLDSGKGESRKRRKVEDVMEKFPSEVLSLVMKQILDVKESCALKLIVQDWNICRNGINGEGPGINNLSIKTYTKGMTPIAEFNEKFMNVNSWCANEYTRAFCRNNTHVFSLLTPNELQKADFDGLTEAEMIYFAPLRGERAKYILPFDDEAETRDVKLCLPSSSNSSPLYAELRHIALITPTELLNTPTDRLLQLPSCTPLRMAAESEEKVRQLIQTFDLDRSSHLWLSWSRMPRLESVILDLRCYAHDTNSVCRYLSKREIVYRATEMGRHLQLELLVLVGLYSYSFELTADDLRVLAEWVNVDGSGGRRSFVGIDEDDAGDVEQWREPDWIRVFASAVRPGGRIVFIDRNSDGLVA
ncbi:hypothetical protein F5Y16DRAFT_389693 [Xylariaceae sp. FL0255]|nr:hypothetical protein F5Y16DRAFT_389693 [Xylariaceae sp. FL0255]